MSKRHEVRSFDYVNHPYDDVRTALTSEAASIFRAATTAAASRAEAVASELHVELAGLNVSKGIAISLGHPEEVPAGPTSVPVTRMPLEWEAADRPRLFPLMKGELSIYPLTATETQLDFAGVYDPPLGPLGEAIDAVVGHRLAEASVHRFLRDVARYLRNNLD